MIYVFIALYPEAKQVIRHYQLKKVQSMSGFETFESSQMRLILTGAGMLAAATAAGSTLACYQAGQNDLLVNWGSCGAGYEIGRVYRCNKISDQTTGFTYYPDMLYPSSLPETSVVTGTQVWKFDEKESRVLHDMEAAALYHAASYFFSPHQMLFFKVVTDQGNKPLSMEMLEQRMEKSSMDFIRELDFMQKVQENQMHKPQELLPDITSLETIFQEFHCSETMKLAFLQCIRYWTLAGIDYKGEINQMRASGFIPCRDKREGVKRFEQLKTTLL